MRQIFTSQRLENVESVARMLNDAGIETWVSEGRSYKGTRRREFSYKDAAMGVAQPGVWIVKAEDLTRAREILRDAGLLESTRPDSFFPSLPDSPRNQASPQGFAKKLRAALLIALAAAVMINLLRACSTPRPEPEDRSHIVPVSTSTP